MNWSNKQWWPIRMKGTQQGVLRMQSLRSQKRLSLQFQKLENLKRRKEGWFEVQQVQEKIQVQKLVQLRRALRGSISKVR
ncbi:hypothetical protein FGO68_gene10762 [Halteria grandinella]|uniref:Uncharacterized protein n=1 Tax=Halteria grandinella TaxID=5974 RepID=A0A8J8NN87_HALGN|nr:hypothetical protein FGO68_gene10762 [Halteria grandinella]